MALKRPTAVPRKHATPADTDAALMGRLASGELGALGHIYDRYRNAVHAFVSRATGHSADVDDLVQNTFLSAARMADRFDGRESCRPLLIGIAGRLVQRRSRALAIRARALVRLAWGRAAHFDPCAELEARSGLSRTAAALARLSPAKRVVLLMAEVEGMSCAEIARALEIPIGTVGSRLHSARAELLAATRDGVDP